MDRKADTARLSCQNSHCGGNMQKGAERGCGGCVSVGMCRVTVRVLRPQAGLELGGGRAGFWNPTCQSLAPDVGAGGGGSVGCLDGETDKCWLHHRPKAQWKLTHAAY